MKISIVIPVYNEAEHLADCLNSIARQTTAPHEVIVVDNNSSDSSLAVALSFDFVSVITEPRQGVVHARNTGFNAAKGDLIGRIDADTVLPADWVAKALQIMQEADVHMTLEDQKVLQNFEGRVEHLAEELLAKGDIW